jgi:selenide,water dikinase
VRVADVPLHDGVLELIRQSVYAGGLRNNRDFLLPRLSGAVTTGAPADEDPRVLALFDPQTSGGLLMAVVPEKHAFLVEELEENGAGAWTIGEVTAAGGDTLAAAGAISLEG